jgi:hypothetical protein
VNTSPGISRSEVGRRGVAGGGERRWQRSAGGGGRRNCHPGPTYQRDEREAASSEGSNQKGKRISANTLSTRGLSGLGRPVGFGLRKKGGQRGSAGLKAEWAARSAGPKVRKKNF